MLRFSPRIAGQQVEKLGAGELGVEKLRVEKLAVGKLAVEKPMA